MTFAMEFIVEGRSINRDSGVAFAFLIDHVLVPLLTVPVNWNGVNCPLQLRHFITTSNGVNRAEPRLAQLVRAATWFSGPSVDLPKMWAFFSGMAPEMSALEARFLALWMDEQGCRFDDSELKRRFPLVGETSSRDPTAPPSLCMSKPVESFAFLLFVQSLNNRRGIAFHQNFILTGEPFCLNV